MYVSEIVEQSASSEEYSDQWSAVSMDSWSSLSEVLCFCSVKENKQGNNNTVVFMHRAFLQSAFCVLSDICLRKTVRAQAGLRAVLLSLATGPVCVAEHRRRMR